MAGTLTTNNSAGLGEQQGYFSLPSGTAINQSFFNTAMAAFINGNKIYKEAYYCDIVQMCNMSMWLENFGAEENDCHPDYTLLEYHSRRRQIRNTVEVTIPVRASGSGTITLSASDKFVSNTYILPQVGNTIVLAPSGVFATVTAVTGVTSIDVQLRSSSSLAQTIPAGSQMLVLPGSALTDSSCPIGNARFDVAPIETDISMYAWGDRMYIEGDALNKCQFLKIPIKDPEGNVKEEYWWSVPQANLYRDMEKAKHYETLLNPSFGIIPAIRARGIKFNPEAADVITTDDVRDWKQALDDAGIGCREYAIFAGREIFSQFQRMLLQAGVTKLDNQVRPMNDCAWINMEYCGIQVEGLTLHIYDDCTFSNGKELGGSGMNFYKSAIFYPMAPVQEPAQRSSIITSRNGYNEKRFTRVYFRDNRPGGKVWDVVADDNGVISEAAGGKNNFGAGCEKQEWTAKTRFANEVHCPASWGYIGLV